SGAVEIDRPPAWRFQTKVRPEARHTASASSSTRVTSVAGTSGAIVRSTVTGGSDLATGAAPASEDANTTAARLVAIGILSAVDEADCEKFDVRNRAERTRGVHSVRRWDRHSRDAFNTTMRE